MRWRAFCLCVLGMTAAGCAPPPSAYAPPPPPEVSVQHPVQRMVPDTLELTGVVRADQRVELRTRVKGFLQKKHVEGGRRVQQGDLLFTIDPRTFEATARQAEAEVNRTAASLRLAEINLARLEEAARMEAASEFELNSARAELVSAKAVVELAEARLEEAMLDLGFTEIRAPIAGRLGLIPVDEGDLVGATEPTLFTTIVNDQKVFAVYDIDEQTVLRLRAASQHRRPAEEDRPNLLVRLGQANEAGFPHEGRFDKADNTLNPETGTIRCEAVFDNPDGAIVPGAFVRVQTVLGARQVMLVPDVAVLSDQQGRYVLVVNDKDTVERRNVQVGPTTDRMRHVLDGLSMDERVVVNGVQRARPGLTVKPILQPPSDSTTQPVDATH